MAERELVPDASVVSATPVAFGTAATAVGARGREVASRSPRSALRRAYRGALLFADALALGSAFGASYWLRFESNLPTFETDVEGSPTFYARVVFLVIPAWLVVFRLLGLYDVHNLLGGTREYALVFNGVSAGMLLVVFITFLSPTFVIARGWLLSAWVLGFLSVGAARFALRRIVYRLRRSGHFVSPTLIIGDNDEARAISEQLSAWQTSGLRLLGFLGDDSMAAGTMAGLVHLGRLEEVEEMVDRLGAEEILVATSAVDRRYLVELFRRYASDEAVEVRLSSGLFEIMTTGLEVKELGYVPLVSVRPARLSGADRAMKWLLDYTVAAGVAVLGFPVLALLACAIRLDSPGPVLHRRRVLGFGGSEFDALKFRTMVVNGVGVLAALPQLAAELEANGKLKNDPRVTRVGRVLRKASLDELPQVFNVLRGQMSIVGPRMITASEHARYGQWDLNLLTVKPGMTGLWQVSGRSERSYEERVQLDMNYIRNWTIWLDLQILLQTIPAVLRGRGAY